MSALRVTVWNEFLHETSNPTVKSIYPDGMHNTLARALNTQPDIKAGTATLGEPEHGLTDAVLENTDVMLWWGHMAHGKVSDAVVEKVHHRVLEGMGLIVLHSGHFSKIFKRLMGTHCSLQWREADEKERLWTIEPGHPIAQGIPSHVEIPATEMYGERFDIPTPDKLIFISWYEGGEVFRSGCTFERGHGRIFYFSPGHEIYPIYHDPVIQQIIINATRWAAPRVQIPYDCPNANKPLEPIKSKR
jgi:trehalose utilization protein